MSDSRTDLLPEPDDLDFDREFGTDTGGIVHPEDLGLPSALEKQCVAYDATTPTAFRAVMGEVLPALPGPPEQYTFVDLGCGKGRVVLMASEIGFRAVIGVEASEQLLDVARKNLEIFPHDRRRCVDVELVSGNAAAYELPPGPLLLFLFNPFDAGIMARLLLHIRESLEEEPRDLWMVYFNPQLRELVGRLRFLVREQRGTGLPQGEHDIYRCVPSLRGGRD